jgi:hypothetical protein
MRKRCERCDDRLALNFIDALGEEKELCDLCSIDFLASIFQNRLPEVQTIIDYIKDDKLSWSEISERSKNPDDLLLLIYRNFDVVDKLFPHLRLKLNPDR